MLLVSLKKTAVVMNCLYDACCVGQPHEVIENVYPEILEIRDHFCFLDEERHEGLASSPELHSGLLCLFHTCREAVFSSPFYKLFHLLPENDTSFWDTDPIKTMLPANFTIQISGYLQYT